MSARPARLLLVPTLILLTLWALAVLPDLIAATPGFWDLRRTLIILSGLLALAWMSGAMLLALRPTWLERRLGGLDKLFRLHKWTGIGAGTLVFVHWMAEILPKSMVGWGWLAAPQRHGPKPPPDFWVGLAKDLGEWTAYILLALVLVALVKRIPYRLFRWVHKAFGVVFLMGAYHGLLLMPQSLWSQPIGWVTAACALLGSGVALASLAGAIGRRRRHGAQLARLRVLDGGLLEVTCRVEPDWPGHRAGQFLLATFDKTEGAHPFTIASAWQPEERLLTLAIKPLGDYTRSLAGRLQEDQGVTLEGPYGDFTFAQPGPQVWVAGGIGITPFLARLEELAAQGGSPERIDFFYSTRSPAEPPYPDRLGERCRLAGVQLHRRYTEQEGPLDASTLHASVTPDSSVWFCGPAAWGAALETALQHIGLPAGRFHRELFEFR